MLGSFLELDNIGRWIHLWATFPPPKFSIVIKELDKAEGLQINHRWVVCSSTSFPPLPKTIVESVSEFSSSEFDFGSLRYMVIILLGGGGVNWNPPLHHNLTISEWAEGELRGKEVSNGKFCSVLSIRLSLQILISNSDIFLYKLCEP